MSAAVELTISGHRPVLSTFTKGVEGARALSFASSEGHYCDPGCAFYGNGCYAGAVERRPDRRELAAKLERHALADPSELARRAMHEARAMPVLPWFRLSTSGAVPSDPSRAFCRALRELLADLRRRGVPVHFPVETAGKARRYRAIVRGLAVVRESAHRDVGRFLRARVPISVAVSAPAGTRTDIRRATLRAAKDVARLKGSSGRRAIVCPAIAASWHARARGLSGLAFDQAVSRSKCGGCTACADPAVDIVYPDHSQRRRTS